jgi:PTH1 family peptidyl-tRNA hydrolase
VALLLGLGNPGPRYLLTRHNMGWLVLDVLADRWSARALEKTGTYEAVRATVDGRDVILMKPLTYMNLSGAALTEWRSRHALEGRDLLAIADDVYLPLGIVRVRERGSSGGHRGLESIENALDSVEFARLRVGVGAAGNGAELGEHVLETFEESEESAVQDAILEAADAAECWVREGPTAAMNRFNKRVRKEVPES